MHVTLTWESVVSAGAVLGALAALWKYLGGAVARYNQPNKNEREIETLRKHHEEDMREQREEQTLIVYGLLACLKGLKEQGCNGPVTEAINKIEKHLNKKAHE